MIILWQTSCVNRIAALASLADAAQGACAGFFRGCRESVTSSRSFFVFLLCCMSQASPAAANRHAPHRCVGTCACVCIPP